MSNTVIPLKDLFAQYEQALSAYWTERRKFGPSERILDECDKVLLHDPDIIAELDKTSPRPGVWRKSISYARVLDGEEAATYRSLLAQQHALAQELEKRTNLKLKLDGMNEVQNFRDGSLVRECRAALCDEHGAEKFTAQNIHDAPDNMAHLITKPSAEKVVTENASPTIEAKKDVTKLEGKMSKGKIAVIGGLWHWP